MPLPLHSSLHHQSFPSSCLWVHRHIAKSFENEKKQATALDGVLSIDRVEWDIRFSLRATIGKCAPYLAATEAKNEIIIGTYKFRLLAQLPRQRTKLQDQLELESPMSL